jgi:hypothetical protein
MRTRSRSTPSSSLTGTYMVRFNKGPGTFTTIGYNPYRPSWNFSNRKEQIVDEVNDPRRKDWKRRLKRNLERADQILDPVLRNSVKSDFYTASMEAHACTHTKNSYSDGQYSVVSSNLNFSWTHTWSGGYAIARKGASLWSSTNDKDYLINWIGTSAHNGSSAAFHTPDWFALLDRWHESCNNLMPSASLLGESMVEHDVFSGAFKAILNPSRAVKTFLQFILKARREKSIPRKLGTMGRITADSFLGYSFGIKPALQELKTIFNAHQIVQKRLQFLRENRGGYVPVRAGMRIPSDFTNSFPGATNAILKHLDAKDTFASISALAKVRPDLDFATEWKAYMQYFGLHKFIGLAWELVPFSFVIDWVTNAGEYINRYTTPHFASPYYNMRNLCHSVKQRELWKLVVPTGYSFSEGYGSTGSDFTVLTGESSSYIRNRGIPSTSGKVDFSLLGTFHAIIGGALLFQKSSIGR